MTGNQENLLALSLALVVAAAAWGWFSDKSRKIKEDDFNRELRRKLDQDRKDFEQSMAERLREIEGRAEYLTTLRSTFNEGMLRGRSWLAHFIAEADRVLDESLVSQLREKKRPAYKAADEVAIARAERRAAIEKAKLLEYQLLSYKEYFPFLEEYEDAILDEVVPLTTASENLEAIESADPVTRFLTKEEYGRLSGADRNQLALDRYLGGGLSPAAIGRLYERYVGYLVRPAKFTPNPQD